MKDHLVESALDQWSLKKSFNSEAEDFISYFNGN